MTRVAQARITVERDEGYASFVEDGETVYLNLETGETLVSFYDLDIDGEWQRFRYARPFGWRSSPQDEFPDHLRSLLVPEDRDQIDEDDIDWCADCQDLVNANDMSGTDHGPVCDSCVENNYRNCDRCSDLYPNEDMIWAYDEDSVCQHCGDNYYTYCDHCDFYVHVDDVDHFHDDEDDCGCEAPAQAFRVRNDGHEPLRNDERTTVELPAGVISERGLREIADALVRHSNSTYSQTLADAGINTYDDYLRDRSDEQRVIITAARAERQKWHNLYYELVDDKCVIGSDWQTKQGNFTKRLSRHAYKAHGLKIPAEVISTIGNIGSRHSQGATHEIAFTRDVNQPRELFAHYGSCWWTEYAESRCALKSNGGFGMRSLTPGQPITADTVEGRAWVMPLKQDASGNLTPTFETESPAAFIVFNGYGNLSGYAPARILAHMAGMTYRRVDFEQNVMYVNGSVGYLVAPEDIAAPYTDGMVRLHVEQHNDLHYRETVERHGLEAVTARGSLAYA